MNVVRIGADLIRIVKFNEFQFFFFFKCVNDNDNIEMINVYTDKLPTHGYRKSYRVLSFFL